MTRPCRERPAEARTTMQSVSPLAPGLPRPGSRVRWTSLHGSARALAIASLARQAGAPVVVITADSRTAHRLEAELEFYLDGATGLLRFPDWETLPYDLFSPPPGHRLGTAGHRRQAAVPRIRGAGDRGHHRDGADCAPRLRRRPPVPDPARGPPRRRDVPPAPGPGRVRLREPGDGARRVRGARLAARSLPDGRRRAASHRSVRRRDREPPRLRPRKPALREPGRAHRPAPGSRVFRPHRMRRRGSGGHGGGVSRATPRDARCIARSARGGGRRASSTTCPCSSRRPRP